MNAEALKEAIQRRKGRGLDLNIMINPEGGMPHADNLEAEEEGEQKINDLAPEVTDDGQMRNEEDTGDRHGVDVTEGEEQAADMEQDKALIAKMLDEHGKSPMREKMSKMPRGKSFAAYEKKPSAL